MFADLRDVFRRWAEGGGADDRACHKVSCPHERTN